MLHHDIDRLFHGGIVYFTDSAGFCQRIHENRRRARLVE